MKTIFSLSWVVGFVWAATLYFIDFNSRSETELVLYSWLWIGLVVFGFAGTVALRKNVAAGKKQANKEAIRSAFVSTAAVLALLAAFYGLLWDAL